MGFLETKFPSSYQNDLNYSKYIKNCSILKRPVPKVNQNILTYNNLSLTEKASLLSHNYDYEKDPLGLFTSNPNDCSISKAWRNIRMKKNQRQHLITLTIGIGIINPYCYIFHLYNKTHLSILYYSHFSILSSFLDILSFPPTIKTIKTFSK